MRTSQYNSATILNPISFTNNWNVIFTNLFSGLTPVFYMPIYVASKYSIVGYTRSVAVSIPLQEAQ